MLTDLTLSRDGAVLHPAAVEAHLTSLHTALACLASNQAGIRISHLPALAVLLAADGPIGALAAAALGLQAHAVRAILFDKTPATNWSLAWHQDRTICVRRRIDVPGFGPWTTKAALQHVAPPFDLLTRMVTLRIHLDDTPANNAPLLIAPGSHRERVSQSAIENTVRRCGTIACLAEAGDIWLYATPILHASEAATRPTRRRVLQVDFAAEELPSGLEWLGVR